MPAITTAKVKSILKDLGYTLISDNRHVKVRDSNGNIRILSRKYIARCADNPRFLRTVNSNRSLYFKNKKEINKEGDVYKWKKT